MVRFLSITILIMTTNILIISMPFNISSNAMSEELENDCRIISNIVDVSTTYPDVVLQKNYDIGKCGGSCTLTRRKIIDGKEVVEKITNDCIPTDIHFLQIYLFDHKTGRINLHEIHEVVVNKCGCKF